MIRSNLFVINFYLSYTVMNYTTRCDEDTAELMEFKKLVLFFWSLDIPTQAVT